MAPRSHSWKMRRNWKSNFVVLRMMQLLSLSVPMKVATAVVEEFWRMQCHSPAVAARGAAANSSEYSLLLTPL